MVSRRKRRCVTPVYSVAINGKRRRHETWAGLTERESVGLLALHGGQ